jgi:hypothetical protein
MHLLVLPKQSAPLLALPALLNHPTHLTLQILGQLLKRRQDAKLRLAGLGNDFPPHFIGDEIHNRADRNEFIASTAALVAPVSVAVDQDGEAMVGGVGGRVYGRGVLYRRQLVGCGNR